MALAHSTSHPTEGDLNWACKRAARRLRRLVAGLVDHSSLAWRAIDGKGVGPTVVRGDVMACGDLMSCGALRA